MDHATKFCLNPWCDVHRQEPLLCPGNHPDRAHQQVSRRPTSKHLWYWENTWAYSPEILWPTPRHDVENYIRGCKVCLASKAVRHTPYGNLQSLPVFTHHWKNLSMNFITGLPISTDWKGDSYDSFLVIVNWLKKMVHYKPVNGTIDAPGFIEVIINVVMRHHGLPDSIVIKRGLFFTSKFWSLLYYFLGIKWRLSTAFYPQTNGQPERKNSTMEAYLWAFVNFE